MAVKTKTYQSLPLKKINDIYEGKWNGLGGKFGVGETPEECVIREVLEESGLSIQNPKYCGLLMFPNLLRCTISVEPSRLM
jgi:8-oxo-dGTP diphosphatase